MLGERQIMLARELTKVHQEFLKGSASVVRENLVQLKGEITVVVGPADEIVLSIDQSVEADALAMAVDMFGQLTKLEVLGGRL